MHAGGSKWRHAVTCVALLSVFAGCGSGASSSPPVDNGGLGTLDEETLAGAYRILAGAKIYITDYVRAVERGDTKGARRALLDLEGKTKDFGENVAVFENQAVAREVHEVHTALMESNTAADALLDYLERGGRLRTRKADTLTARWIEAGEAVNSKLGSLPDRLRPHLSDEQEEQLDAAVARAD